MGLFHKKEKIPDIPPAHNLPKLPEMEEIEERDLPELPSLPNNHDINREMVKSAVTDASGEEEIPEEEEVKPKTIELDEGFEEEPEEEALPSPPEEVHHETHHHETHHLKNPNHKTHHLVGKHQKIEEHKPEPEKPKRKEIFVKISKFRSAQKNLENIQKKIQEIGKVVADIKEVNLRERKEVENWVEELAKLKEKLAEIDKDIFGEL